MIYKDVHIHISPQHYNANVKVSIVGKDDKGINKVIHTQVLNSSVFLDNSSFTYKLDELLIGKETKEE